MKLIEAASLARRLGAMLAVMIVVSGIARAEPVFSFDATPGKLPKTVVPIHYAIELRPDAENLTLGGVELIDIEVREPTARLTLNAVSTAFASVTIDGGAERADIALDAAAETATFTFAQPLAAGAHRLRVEFTAGINKFDRGFFFVDYPTDNGTRRLLTSKLEPADARRIFPCWDEPAFKASFGLTVIVPRHLVAVANMPVTREEMLEPNLKRVAFASTPRMSTYLFVLMVGELERITAEAEGVTIGIVATMGKAAKGQFALDSAMKLLGWFNDYFGVKYPLPKLDLIAVPGGFGGAMENWGGITFFESRLLFDPATNPDSARRGIFSIIAHEMAHQWFGDLVTMAWWDNLWLNEGFATWMATKAAEQFHPQWQGWLNGYGQKQFAMALDARRTTHPIQQAVANESEAMVAFDAITYNKGQALIRMLENYLGEAAFRDGIRAYMAAHAYSNTTTADLWRALERAGHKPVAEIAASFTEQDGVPLVWAETVCQGGTQRMMLRQDRFAIAPAWMGPALPPRNWQVPVAIGPLGATPPADVVLLRGSAEVAAGSCGEAVKANLGDIGYYRVEYGPASRMALTKALPRMSATDRVNFLADSWAMVQAGRAEPPSYLALVEQISADDRRPVWDQVIGVFSSLNRLSRERTERPALQRYARAKLRPVLDRLGWNGSGSGDDDDTLLRSSLIWTLGDLGDEDVIAEARRRFAGFLGDPQSLPNALRDAVTHVTGVTADRATYDALLALARKSTVTSERTRYYLAAASGRDPALARATLALTLTDEVPGTIVTGMINSVGFSGEQPGLAWEFLQKNYDALFAKQGPQFRDQFVANFMTNFSDESRATELAAFAPAQATSGGRVMAGRARETIAISADLKARALPAIEVWIRERK
ncbi:M1 family metallopeptidase [Bradyrhizobium sp. BWA-3-5]|uniref:M1 family metallopeptidase n=1 Tax=Bradyrhizobium sp. BWA-3-5 TaxID=3080013 RepID=UPI00293E5116|nr:M1 family metallopeptidase [Bradyrhizobium sp. BWA-3-5]WOH65421.1 M1 family metallopeptidase [Bradyrhizobium sp. BWA-3-5]